MATIQGGAGNDTLLGTTGKDTILGLNGNDVLYGDALSDYMEGGAGNDTLDGGSGWDYMLGGAGNDVYYVDATGDLVYETTTTTSGIDAGGIDAIVSDVTFSLAASGDGRQFVENLYLTGSSNLNITGNDLANYLAGNSGSNLIRGGAGNDTIDGGAGNDTLKGEGGADHMFGGAGNDIYVVDSFSDWVYETTTQLGTVDAGGIDQVRSSVTYSIADIYNGSQYIENLMLIGTSNVDGTGNSLDNIIDGNTGDNGLYGGDGNDTIRGNAGDDYAEGGNGDDLMNGQAGSDTMLGGAGNDVYIVNLTTDEVYETTTMVSGIDAGGIDEVQAGATYSIADSFAGRQFIENITLLNTGNYTAEGNSLDNTLIGNTGHNRLYGNAGDDTLKGGNGLDTLDGGTGNDVMLGGNGSDTYYVDSVDDRVYETTTTGSTTNAGGSNDTVISTVTYSIHNSIAGRQFIEHLTLAGTANINGTGNGNNNRMTGNSGNNSLWANGGNDTLDGGAGADQMFGGAGNDTYYVDNTSDTVFETASTSSTIDLGGNDLVVSSVTYSIIGSINGRQYIEGLRLTGNAAIDAFGNYQDNTLTGNGGVNHIWGYGGNDTIDGGASADYMFGGAGNDTFIVNTVNDRVFETVDDISTDDAGGTDTVIASSNYSIDGATNGRQFIENLTLDGTGNFYAIGNDLDNVLTGNDGANSITGGAGLDTLDGGAGKDTLTGGADADTFAFDDGDSAATNATADIIADFSQGDGDVIDLSAIDADSGTLGDQGFTWIDTAAFSGTVGELRYAQTGGNTYVYGDVDGDASADFAICVTGLVTFDAADFVL